MTSEPAQGAEFTVTLPLTAPLSTTPRESAHPASAAENRGAP